MMEPIILPRISNQKPLVSVVSTTFNHEPYIRDCMEGFLMQKTDFPVEIIIHDDASTDHTADIIREYYEKRPDLFHVIIERENQYSQGKEIWIPMFAQAQGKYIALCEGDDYWTDPHKLQEQFDFMEKNSDYSCCFNNAVIYDQGNDQKKIQYATDQNKTFYINDLVLRGGGLMTTASMFFKKNLTNDFAAYKKSCPVGDYPLALCLANKGKTMMLSKTMSIYRKNTPNSWSSNIKRHNQLIDNMIIQAKWWDQNLRHLVNCNEKIIDGKISHLLFRINIESNRTDEIKTNKYCRQLVSRMDTCDRLLLWIWLLFLGKFLKTNKISRFFTCTRILEKDTERLLHTYN